MPHRFRSKAQTLAYLQGRITSASIAPITILTVAEWREDPKSCLARIALSQSHDDWIVRSSSHQEDRKDGSRAGVFLSVLNVSTCNLPGAVNKVISAYRCEREADEILVQPMLHKVLRSGVASSHEASTGSPYRLVNWTESGDTTLVTSGHRCLSWTQAALYPGTPPSEVQRVLTLLNELLDIFDKQPLQIEFAFTRDRDIEKLWLLQARPLVLSLSVQADSAQATRLIQIENDLTRGMQDHKRKIGEPTVYGVMPDWNPAEIIGLRPKPLALSLYRALITDEIWAYPRCRMGYRDLRGQPLMVQFFGLPYIDARLSVSSLIPAGLDANLANRLSTFYIDYLVSNPLLHDKIESDVVISCYSFDISAHLTRLDRANITSAEIILLSDCLRKITNFIINPHNILFQESHARLRLLQQRRKRLTSSSLPLPEKIHRLLNDARSFGAIPFATFARASFVAVQLLRSMAATGILTPADLDSFFCSISTVTSELIQDQSNLEKCAFLKRYGHLRPGTYDIQSPRYDAAPDRYFNWAARRHSPAVANIFSLSTTKSAVISKELSRHNIEATPESLLLFIKNSIAMREKSKFLFTQNISDALELISDLGKDFGIDRDDMSYCNINSLRSLYTSPSKDPGWTLRSSVEYGMRQYQDTLTISLPPLITSPADVWGFKMMEAAPTFVTQKKVTARVEGGGSKESVSGAIVCIPNADPGFDWLFSHSIAGLITAWGGANSHMAVRASELRLPAVIGAGEMLFRRWSQAQMLSIDCASCKIEIVA